MIARLIIVVVLLPIISYASIKKSPDYADLEADEIKYEKLKNNEQIIKASGDVKVNQEGKILTSQTLTYFIAQDKIIAKGNVIIKEPGGYKLFADYIEIKDKMKAGIIKNFQLRFPDNSLLKGQEATKINDDLYNLLKGSYSPCKLLECEKNYLWQVRANKVIYDRQKEEVSYQNAFFDIKGVPVLYTPFFMHPTPKAKRKSGLLSPIISSDSYYGRGIIFRYYYNIAPNKDLTTSVFSTSKRGPLLINEYRHLTDRGKYQLNFSIKKRKEIPNEKINLRASKNITRGHIYGKGNFVYDNNYHYGFDINLTKDKTYIENFGFEKDKTNRLDILTNKLFINYYNEHNFIKMESIYFQNLQNRGKLNDTPRVLPVLDAYIESDELGGYGKAYFKGNMLNLYRKNDIDINRFSSKFGYKLPFISNYGHIITFDANIRGDFYKYNRASSDYNYMNSYNSADRFVPELLLYWRYPWVGQYIDGNILLEPIINLAVSPTVDYNKKVFNEDSQYITLSDTNIFADNRFAGLDFIESGARVSYGFKTSFYKKNDINLNAMLGQSYINNIENYHLQQKSDFINHFSDYIGRIGFSYKNEMALNYRFLLSRDNLRVKRQEIELNKNFNKISLNLSYIGFNDNLADSNGVKNRRELFFETSLNNYKNWTIAANIRTNLTHKSDNSALYLKRKNIVTTGGKIFRKGDCVDYSIAYERDFTTMAGKKPSQTWWFRIWLKNIM